MAKLLVGHDGSAEADLALKMAVRLARATQSKLLIASAVPPIATGYDLDAAVVGRLIDEQVAWTEKLLEKLRKPLTDEGLQVETRLLMGSPARELVHLAENDREVEMVLVGRTGMGRVARVLLGSVADRVLHTCPKPVMVVS